MLFVYGMSYGLVFGALLAVLCLSGFVGGLVWWVRRPLSSRRMSTGALPLFGHDRAVVYARAGVDDQEEDDRAQLIVARASRWATPSPRTDYSANSTASTLASASATATQAEQFDGQSVRYSVPTDSTLQFLPGRLAIVGGPDVGRDIRFVRTPGRDVVDVTFGRNEGPAYRHVQLHDATVSRSHARMRYRDGRWLLANLSATNPVLHNGDTVQGEVDRLLTDGDRIEMGEVVFEFHA